MTFDHTIDVWRSVDLRDRNVQERLGQTTAMHIVVVEEWGELLAGALGLIESTLARFETVLLYGDSLGDRESGHRVARPAFSPLRLREQNYLGPVVVFSVEWLRSIGPFDPLDEGSITYELALHFRGSPERAIRIPEPLSRERAGASDPARDAAAVERRLAAFSIPAVVSRRPDGSRMVRYLPTDSPLVSIIVPTRGSTATIRGSQVTLVVEAIRSAVERTDYENVEYVVVADDPTPQAVVDELRAIAGDRLRMVRYPEPFNFSSKINRGAVYARGEYLLLLNDDVEVIDPGWISTLVGLAQQPGVGIVGSLLLFEDGSVQHGGHLYRESWAGHIESPQEIGGPDTLSAFAVTREVSGVTAACALVASDTFWQVGGLSADFPGNYNDVDFSLKIRATGRSAVWSPDARLFHFESKTRDATVTPHEIALLRRRWGTRLLVEQYWNE
jgi:GT2 family glycosyltransferase